MASPTNGFYRIAGPPRLEAWISSLSLQTLANPGIRCGVAAETTERDPTSTGSSSRLDDTATRAHLLATAALVDLVHGAPVSKWRSGPTAQ